MHSYSNLWYVKYGFMNNKSNYSKYVYHPIDGEYICMDARGNHWLFNDFDYVSYAFTDHHCIRYEWLISGKYPAKAWKDKHGNIIIRVFHEDKQTKIDF